MALAASTFSISLEVPVGVIISSDLLQLKMNVAKTNVKAIDNCLFFMFIVLNNY